jgi:hypothetical protein
MSSCPACGAEPPTGSAACPGCGLAAELFEPIHLVVGGSPSDGRYAEDVRAIIDALGELAAPAPAPPPGGGGAPSIARPPGEPAPARSALALTDLPERPAEPSDLAGRRQRDQAYLDLAGRLGLDVAEAQAEARRLAVVDEPEALDRLGRALFVRLADRLTVRYEGVLERREELARLVPTDPLDRELALARARLAEGALVAAEGALEAAGRALEQVEEEWGPVEVLWENARALTEGVRSFGADPSPALGPVSEGERLARAGERRRAETVLAAGNLALWTLLNPLVRADLTERVRMIRTREAEGAHVGPALAEMQEFGTQLRAKNFTAALAAYRRAGEWLEPRGSEAAGDRSLNNAGSVPPA